MPRLSPRPVFLGLGGLALVLVLLLPQLHTLIPAFRATLSDTERLTLDLVQIGLIALILAALLSPLESLGWWAGWYGDQVKTTACPGTVEDAVAADQASRYIVYLDGIGQSQHTYSPEAEEFLQRLGQALPEMVLIRGIMPYSVLNRSLTSDRTLSWFWRLVNWLRVKRSLGMLGILINIHNALVVAVSADGRYGPIYNRGMAQLIYNSLIDHGYRPGSRVPITLLGFSGGGEISMGSAPFLKQVLDAPLEIISMAGVFCGHNDILRLEHIYHLVGDKDPVERLGPIFFPKRWKLMALSYWNRAKRRGAVTFISLGPVGHQTPGGVLDPNQKLPDGRTHLQQTLDWVTEILQGTLPAEHQPPVRQPSSYALFQQGRFNHPDYYPVPQTPDTDHYRPIAPWMGRLILPTPDQRQSLNGVWFEVYHAEAPYADLVGQVVPLGWQDGPRVKAYGEAVTRDLHFSADADYSLRQGKIVPERLNGWRLVDPLESLAGARPTDNMVVMLNGLVVVQAPAAPDQGTPRVLIAQDPAEITGRYYAIVQFIAPLAEDGDGVPYRVRHFNKTSRQFDGMEEVVLLPQVIPNENGLPPSSSRDLAQSPCNVGGWYIYGAKNHGGQFVVQALAPRQLFSLQPDRELVGKKPATEYLKKGSWALAGVKGTISSVLLRPRATTPEVRMDFQAGDRLLLNHLYGGIGGKMREPAAQGPVYFGHFAYGLAEVVLEPLTDELRLEIQYFQVYAHNGDGLIACRHHWSNYMGDRQYGWLGLRPVRDIVIKLEAFTGTYDLDGEKRSPLDGLIDQLQIMMARYRIGDGTGSTFVGPANNCAQDSNQALYAALQRGSRARAWTQVNPDAAPQIKQLIRLGRSLKRDLLPWGTARADWKGHETVLGSSLEDDPLKQLWMGLVSWRTVLPRVASDAVVQSFLQQGATVLVLRTSQVGGSNPDIDSIAPLSL